MISDASQVLLQNANKDLQKMITEKIIPAFQRLENQKLRDTLRRELTVESFSVEGDEITQLLDCVIMGPYAAADLSFNLHTAQSSLHAVQYHRGDASSRSFTTWGPVGGTDARKLFHAEVLAQIGQQGVMTIADEAYNHFLHIRSLFLEPSADSTVTSLAPGLMCACDESLSSERQKRQVVSPSLECCALNSEFGIWTERTDIRFSNFDVDLNKPVADIGSQVLDTAINQLISERTDGLRWTELDSSVENHIP